VRNTGSVSRPAAAPNSAPPSRIRRSLQPSARIVHQVAPTSAATLTSSPSRASRNGGTNDTTANTTAANGVYVKDSREDRDQS
jgi:hypothetical protein